MVDATALDGDHERAARGASKTIAIDVRCFPVSPVEYERAVFDLDIHVVQRLFGAVNVCVLEPQIHGDYAAPSGIVARLALSDLANLPRRCASVPSGAGHTSSLLLLRPDESDVG